jgi:hypothetical protein
MPSSDVIKAAWITGTLTVAGAIVGAIFTGGYGLTHPGPATTPTPSPPTTITSSPAANPDTVPSDYQGTWTGTVTQSNGTSFQLTLKIGSGSVENAIGSWQLPTFNCSGILILESGGGPLELYQETTFNGNGECYAHFTSDIALQGSGLGYQIIGGTSTSGQFFSGNLASGDLSEN